jgi:hypothetical protein
VNTTKQKIAPCQASRKDAHMLLSGSEKQSAKKLLMEKMGGELTKT